MKHKLDEMIEMMNRIMSYPSVLDASDAMNHDRFGISEMENYEDIIIGFVADTTQWAMLTSYYRESEDYEMCAMLKMVIDKETEDLANFIHRYFEMEITSSKILTEKLRDNVIERELGWEDED